MSSCIILTIFIGVLSTLAVWGCCQIGMAVCKNSLYGSHSTAVQDNNNICTRPSLGASSPLDLSNSFFISSWFSLLKTTVNVYSWKIILKINNCMFSMRIGNNTVLSIILFVVLIWQKLENLMYKGFYILFEINRILYVSLCLLVFFLLQKYNLEQLKPLLIVRRETLSALPKLLTEPCNEIRKEKIEYVLSTVFKNKNITFLMFTCNWRR